MSGLEVRKEEGARVSLRSSAFPVLPLREGQLTEYLGRGVQNAWLLEFLICTVGRYPGLFLSSTV